MFERYTERARRVLFFARYEASLLGGQSIETEHMLLGLVREGAGITNRIFARADLPLDTIRSDVRRRVVAREKISTSVEIPFSADTKRVLHHAAAEADRMKHDYIGTEHLLLGLLREKGTVAASVLASRGLTLDGVRSDLDELLRDTRAHEETPDTASRVDAVKALVARVNSGPHTAATLNELVAEIQQALDDLKRVLGAP